MKPNVKSVPNQKIVTVNKEKCNSANLYAAINISAMEKAAQALDAGAFKLWVYFAKNQDKYQFALSSKAVEENFGIKIKQYNNAISALIEQGYLVQQGDSNNYTFSEVAVMSKEDNAEQIKNNLMTKGNNGVMPKKDNSVNTKSNNALLPLDIRNITDNTYNNTTDTTGGFSKISYAGVAACSTDFRKAEANQKERVVKEQAIVLTNKEAMKKYGVSACANRVRSGVNDCYWISGELVQLV